MGAMSTQGRVRIGELSRRTGVSIDLLRVWERRYGVLAPERTAGGQRLYSVGDEQRIRAMQAHLTGGMSAGEAARLVTQSGGAAVSAGELARPLVAALDDLDEAGAHAALDRVFGELGVESALTDVLMPYLRELGDRWACAEVTAAEEHFASRLLHARLLGVARGWDGGSGPRALLACPPGEEHDLALIAFGIALSRRGWRVTYLGANTPIGAIQQMVRDVDVEVVVLAATTPVRFAEVIEQLRELARAVPVAIAGAGANARLAEDAGARLLEGDPVAGSAEIARAA
jgi:MerR family transcriptional regulator, light-induced transcriptional regulator